MKLKLITSLLMVTIGSSAFADSLSCQVAFTRANAGGLMPDSKTSSLKIAEIQSRDSFKLEKCTMTMIEKQNIELCAQEHEAAKGVYRVSFMVSTTAEQDIAADFGGGLLALPVRGNNLVDLNVTSILSPTFRAKMIQANLDFPNYQGGDSLKIDDAVSSAYAKGVLTKSDIVVLDIQDCQIVGTK